MTELLDGFRDLHAHPGPRATAPKFGHGNSNSQKYIKTKLVGTLLVDLSALSTRITFFLKLDLN